MARRAKQTVDYFPHDAHAGSGNTITILQNRFGNNGYAVWFKLLEKLSSTEGHYLDCRNKLHWQLLVAYLGSDEITTVEILNLLVEIGAIDKDLWTSKLIWCQKLVDNLADVYKNRRITTPNKPIITPFSENTTDNNDGKKQIAVISTDNNGITTGENTQSKLNKSKVNNNVFSLYEKYFGQMAPAGYSQEMSLAEEEYPLKWLEDAFSIAAEKGNKNWGYVAGILRNKLEAGMKPRAEPAPQRDGFQYRELK